jgi:hypothetical protein
MKVPPEDKEYFGKINDNLSMFGLILNYPVSRDESIILEALKKD